MNFMNFTLIFAVLLWSFSPHVKAEESCSMPEPLPENLKTFIKDNAKVVDAIHNDVATFKVEHDGEGKLSVFYENGEPKILKFTYKNKKGTVVIQKTFEELENGSKLIYENQDKPGPAIILEKGAKFKNGDGYSFKLTTRTKMKPASYTSYPIELRGDDKNPQLLVNKRQCKNVILSPGVSFTLSWDGTFEKVDFK
jgi:hypothetical protein